MDYISTLQHSINTSIDIKLFKNIKEIKWEYDIPGYMTLKSMKWIIKNNRLIPQNALLNGKIKKG